MTDRLLSPRIIHAEFLRWAVQQQGGGRGTAWSEAAEMLDLASRDWRAVAELARDADPQIRQACDAIDRRAELLDSGAKPEKLQKAYGEQVAAVAASKISAAQADHVRAAIAEHVEVIVGLEGTAIAALLGEPTVPRADSAAKRHSSPSAASAEGDNDRVTLLNPNTGRTDKTIARSIHAPVQAAILAALDDQPDLLFGDLYDEVEGRTDPALWKTAKVGWYTVGVKLDMEARGLIERHSSPQRLRLTDAGREALE